MKNGIKLDGDTDFLDLYEDTEIEMQIESPLFGDADRLSPGSLTIPFDVPGAEDSPTNAQKLNHPDVIENRDSFSVNKATHYYDGVPFKKGNLKSRVTKDGKISANFFFGLNSIDPRFKKAKCKDVFNEDIVIDSSSITKKLYIKYTGSGDISITVNGKPYSGANWTIVYLAINADADAALDTGQYMPYATLHSSGSSPGGLTADYIEIHLSLYYTYHDPTLMMDFLLRADSTDPLAELSVNVDTPADYLVESFDMSSYYGGFSSFLAGYLSGVYPTEKFRFPIMFNADLHENNPKLGQIINGVNGSGIITNDANFGFNNAQPLAVRNYNSLQPFLRLKWVLDKIADTFGFEWEGDFYDDANTTARLIDNSITLDVPLDYIGNTKFIFWRRSFNLNELISDITVVDFLKAISGRYNVAIYYNELTGKVAAKYREVLAKSTVSDEITPYCSPVIQSEDLRVTGISLKISKEDTDAYSTDETITIGEAEEPIEIKCGRLFSIGSTVLGGGYVEGPKTSRRNLAKFGLRVFHYKGIINNGVFSYPAAAISSDTQYEGLADNITLTGIYNTFHKYWNLFTINRVSVSVEAKFELANLLRFDFTLKRRYDRNKYLLKVLKVKLGNKGISVTSLELYTMR